MNLVKLRAVQGADAGPWVTLSAAPLLVGRAPGNDVVLTDDQISWHHAAFWTERGQLWVRDLASKNGTFVGKQRVVGAMAVPDGAELTLGPNVSLQFSGSTGSGEHTVRPAIFHMVEDVGSSVRLPIRSDRFHIGSGADADLYMPDAPARAATLLVREDGEIWLGTDDGEIPLDARPFVVAGRTLRLLATSNTQAPTVEPEADRYPYKLSATLDGPTGPSALLEAPRLGLKYVVDSDNRAVMLYILARKAREDLDAGLGALDAGWVADEDITVGIWGKQGLSDPNGLHVLVYRVRRELQGAGFDPWFIEKRRRAVRVRLSEVHPG